MTTARDTMSVQKKNDFPNRPTTAWDENPTSNGNGHHDNKAFVKSRCMEDVDVVDLPPAYSADDPNKMATTEVVTPSGDRTQPNQAAEPVKAVPLFALVRKIRARRFISFIRDDDYENQFIFFLRTHNIIDIFTFIL